jgi:hypothetical protein
MITEATPAGVPATPAPVVPAPHLSFLDHLKSFFHHFDHLAAFVAEAAPIAIQAGVHLSPQAAIAIEALSALKAAHDAAQPAPATPAEPAQ